MHQNFFHDKRTEKPLKKVYIGKVKVKHKKCRWLGLTIFSHLPLLDWRSEWNWTKCARNSRNSGWLAYCFCGGRFSSTVKLFHIIKTIFFHQLLGAWGYWRGRQSLRIDSNEYGRSHRWQYWWTPQWKEYFWNYWRKFWNFWCMQWYEKLPYFVNESNI